MNFYPEFYFRYNVLKNQVEIKVDPQDQKIYTLPKSNTNTYNLKDYSYQYRTFNLAEKGITNSYFLIYYESEHLLFLGKPKLNIKKEVEKKSGFGASKPARYEVEIDWYLKKDKDIFSKINLRERDLKGFFDSKKMEAYFDDHKIKTESDVVKMLKFYENLE